MPAEQPLLGKTALVTGAGRGLGRAYALHLAQLGADLAVLDADLHSYAAFAGESNAMTPSRRGQSIGAASVRIRGGRLRRRCHRRGDRRDARDLGRLDIACAMPGRCRHARRDSGVIGLR